MHNESRPEAPLRVLVVGGGFAGLGLAITRSILEAHRGRIACESAHGLTRFVLALPQQH